MKMRRFRRIKALAALYLALSVLTLGVAALLRDHPSQVNDTVWIRGVIVALSACVTLSFAVHAARGAPRALLRLRIITIVMPVAIVVIVALPGLIPTWMKIEQAACGVLLVWAAVLAHEASRTAREVTRSGA